MRRIWRRRWRRLGLEAQRVLWTAVQAAAGALATVQAGELFGLDAWRALALGVISAVVTSTAGVVSSIARTRLARIDRGPPRRRGPGLP